MNQFLTIRDKTTHFYSFLIIIPFYQIFCWMGFRHCQHLRHLPCQQNHVQVLIDPKSFKVFFYFEKLQAATPWDFSSVSLQAASIRGSTIADIQLVTACDRASWISCYLLGFLQFPTINCHRASWICIEVSCRPSYKSLRQQLSCLAHMSNIGGYC